MPVTRFEFATAQRIVFGSGSRQEVAPLARTFGSRVLVVTGRNPDRAAPLLKQLREAGVAPTVCTITREPTTDTVLAGREQARQAGVEVVIGFGGGSALDAAKAIAALLTNQGELLDYLEVIGQGKPLTNVAAPCLAVPTTAGTGTEVTRNAVLASPEHRVKVSLRSPHLLPRVAVVDPELTHGLPPNLTASTGLDALTQLIEPYVGKRANPLVDALCVEGLRRVARSLRRVYENGTDPAAREDMALASLFGGLALANAGLGAVHGFAAPIGGRFPAPHGAVCAALLPSVMAMNVRTLRAREPESKALRRYEELGRILTGRPQAGADDGVVWVGDLCRALAVPSLRTYNLSESDVADIVPLAMRASSMRGNPIVLEPNELSDILRQAL